MEVWLNTPGRTPLISDVITTLKKRIPKTKYFERVMRQKVMGWACSFSKKKEVGIATFEKSRKWIVSSRKCNRICHNPIMCYYIL